ncbi:MAG: sulfotransferase domain-containing protein [Planctomycetaceae bacterium]|nr:sulfotransferase domain-containing protein [Planctomycetaceae bacterium]
MITIVSGLPRSGTSLLMQMLASGGYPVLCDDERRADEDNPRGYFEYTPVRRLEQDNHWLAQAEGKALKVVSPLLSHLPKDFNYRLIFMQRGLEEVLRSQAQMLIRKGQSAASHDPAMQLHFERHLRAVETWVEQHSNVSRLTLAYAEVIAEPRFTAERLAEFLGTDLNVERMVGIVDPALYRQRAT